VRLWDVATHTPLGAPIPDSSEAVIDLAFTPDGTKLVAAESDGDEALLDSILWRGSDRALRARACAATRRDLSRAEWRVYLPSRPYHRTCSGA